MMAAHERKYHGGGGPGGDVTSMTMGTAMIDKRDKIEGAIRREKNRE
jgi:hypothetical protein